MEKKFTALQDLNKKCKVVDSSLSVIDLFNLMRQKYVEKVADEKILKFIEARGSEFPKPKLSKEKRNALEKIIQQQNLDWESIDFHLKYRLTTLNELYSFFPEIAKENHLVEVIEKGFCLSILPLNLSLPKETIEKSIPQSDYFDIHLAKDPDPYGIFLKRAKILDKNGKYLCSRKFKHSVLMNIHVVCPIGCSGCYKAYFTREKRKPLSGLEFNEVIDHTKRFVEWLNIHPEVYDVIISGGEPLMVGNETIKKMFEYFKKAKHLKIIRICTGTIFLGLPFRIDDELLDFLKSFENETGKRITFNAHLANHYNISPEALIAVKKIQEKGFRIYSQVPIMEGINFFKKDIKKTIAFWVKLGKMQSIAGIEPYKFIFDMHPRTLKYYVPLELVLKVWSVVYDSHDFPELGRPKTLSILCQQGNIVLSHHTLFAMKKSVNEKSKIVTYTIPAVIKPTLNGAKIEKFFNYVEPLLEENKEKDSLIKVAESFFSKK